LKLTVQRAVLFPILNDIRKLSLSLSILVYVLRAPRPMSLLKIVLSSLAQMGHHKFHQRSSQFLVHSIAVDCNFMVVD
jgi:hypothetical protein